MKYMPMAAHLPEITRWVLAWPILVVVLVWLARAANFVIASRKPPVHKALLLMKLPIPMSFKTSKQAYGFLRDKWENETMNFVEVPLQNSVLKLLTTLSNEPNFDDACSLYALQMAARRTNDFRLEG